MAGLSSGSGVVGSSSGFYQQGWFSDWQATGLVGVAIVCAIIALAAMIGKAFNLPEVKAFANNELKQAIISAILIVSLVALVAFFNEIAVDAVAGADLPVPCNSNEPCYITAAKYYLKTLFDTGSGYAENNLEESIKRMKRASYGYNLNFNKIYLLFAGMSIRFNAGDSIMGERHGAMFSQVSKILASIYAQKYFIDVITFGIAPLFILLGIVLRTFFFTRKLGGLLLAIAISLFIIYPLTYVFAWYTLNVTVYGERTLAVGDPACPGECTSTYPVAFFVDGSNGKLVQFPTTQSLIRTGINASNWASGDVNGDGTKEFPGLVACRDLTQIGILSATAPNSCPDCPDYCRDVPFPTGMPGCNITKCAACNSGCKIVRQRLNCEVDPACTGKCPLKCRTRIPTENKCFSNETGGIIPANLSVNCGGCDKYPAWCRFLKVNATTNKTERVYDDPQLNMACAGVDNDPTCPAACSYITYVGTDATCDSMCSVTDKNTGTKTVCPKQCRVTQLFNSTWTSIYDTDPPNLTIACSDTPEKAAACAVCKQFPECMVEVPMPQLAGCASYPTTAPANTLCLSCPDYCRRDNFNNYFTGGFSLVDRNPTGTGGTPAVCDPTKYPEINCSTSACATSCRTSPDVPLICRPYSSAHTLDNDVAICRGCPDNARYKLHYSKNGPGYNCTGTIPNYEPPSGVAPAGEYNIILSGTTSGSQLAAGTAASEDGTVDFAGRGGTISFNGCGVTVNSVRIDPNGTVYPNASTVLVGWCKAYLTTGNNCNTASEANHNAVLERKDGTISLGSGSTVRLDPSNDLTYNFVWYKNGVAYANGQWTTTGGQDTFAPINIQPAELFVGDIWTFSCKATHIHGSEYFESTWANSTNTTLASGPVVSGARILPATTAYTADTLKGYCNATFAANSSANLTYEYRWYKNGALNRSGNVSGPFTQGLEINLANISSANLSVGQNWTFSCRANATNIWGVWINSTNTSIAATPGPVVQSANITPATTAYQSDTLKGNCSANYSYDPSATLTFEYRWYVNGTLSSQGNVSGPFGQNVQVNLANATGPILKYQNWTFSCRANASNIWGNWFNSTKTYIAPNPPEPDCTQTDADINLTTGVYHCEPANCPTPFCYSNVRVQLPNEDVNIACKDANVTECPYGCRVLGLDGYINPGCPAACASLPAACFFGAPSSGAGQQVTPQPLCSEYLGNGPKSCHGAVCTSLSQEACGTSPGCSWSNGYCDDASCLGKNQSACTGACSWIYTHDVVPINMRAANPYGNPAACRQCPEQCRVDNYTGICGVKDNGVGIYVDCSLNSCPEVCRIPQPLPETGHDECQPYPEESGMACKDCPALCRRSSELMAVSGDCPGSCQLGNDPMTGCTEGCMMDDPPERPCEGCFDCDTDCTYYPAIRTDCSDICSDEALAGPVNIGPEDFIKSLPGAATSANGESARSIGILYIPAVVLPLFCIVIVVAFIRILSPILGGDIEIPGLGRII